MQIGNKLFPYPTINKSILKNCFKETRYEFKCEDLIDGQYYILKDACITINNQEIIEMLNKNVLGAALIIECSTTVFRKMYEVNLIPQDIKINIGDLRDKVVVSCYIYAKQEIKSFMNSDFDEDYEGYSFVLEKNDILAIDDGFTIMIDFDESLDKKVSSIFQVIRNKSAEIMEIEKKAKKIVISLPEETFKYYESMRKKDSFQNIFFSMLAIPALTYCLKEIQEKLKRDEVDMDMIELEYSWVVSVKNAYKNTFGEDLTEEVFKNIDVSKVVQKILNNGSVAGINDLFDISIQGALNRGELDE